MSLDIVNSDGEPFVTTATRQSAKLRDIPANISVISEAVIQASHVKYISELLKSEAGIVVSDITGNGRSYNIDIRGFGETANLNTLVLVDGRRVNQADLSATDWTQISVDRVKRIEILRGGSGSVLYGDNASGGVINIITKAGGAKKLKVETSGGSYQTSKSSISFDNVTDSMAYSFSASYLTSGGYRQNSKTEARDVGGKLDYVVNDAFTLRFSGAYHSDETGLPGSLKLSDLNAGVSRKSSTKLKDFANVQDYYLMVSPEYTFGENSRIVLDTSYRQRNSLSFSSFTGGEFTGDTKIETVAFSPHISFHNGKNSFVAGFDYQDAKERINNNSLFFGTRTIGNFVLQKKSYGYYAHDSFNLSSGLSVSAGYRYERGNYIYKPGTPERSVKNTNAYSGAVHYELSGNTSLYAGYARSFRYPVIDEMFNFFNNTVNTALKVQKSDDYEAGIKHHFSDNLSGNLNLFFIDTKQEIFYNPVNFANENMQGITRRKGIEVGFTGWFSDIFQVKGSYSYTDAKIRDGQFAGKNVPNVPNHHATLNASYLFSEGFDLAVTGTYVGERPLISDFNNAYAYQKSYIRTDVKLSYSRDDMSAFIGVNNITNSKYAEYGVLGGFPTAPNLYPSPEINVLAGVSVQF